MFKNKKKLKKKNHTQMVKLNVAAEYKGRWMNIVFYMHCANFSIEGGVKF